MLVIVESFSKCKMIEGFLGSEYKCIATNGHFRTITDLNSIDFEKMKIKYSIIEKQQKNLQKMKKEISKANCVFLATDNDREGEAIAWHICDLFKLSLDTPRIVFNEITEACILDSIHRPRSINMEVVKMQQNRQVLDILIGYKVSPLLWKHVSRNAEKSLSAGRCQTPALRIIYDHHLLKKPCSNEYIIKGYFTANNILFKTTVKEDVVPLINSTEKFLFTKEVSVNHISPPTPFTTSTILQSFSSVKEIMKACCNLYEKGYITYPRTSSTFYSKTFIESAKKYILINYGENYISTNIPEQIASEAHEAIRVTDINVPRIFGDVPPKEAQIYERIWQNSLQSCMSAARTQTIECCLTRNNLVLKCREEDIVFQGWKKKDNRVSQFHYLNNISENMLLTSKKLTAQFSPNSKNHYSEGSLVKKLEELGIGKPSTFANLVNIIQDRKYVIKTNIKGESVEKMYYEMNDVLTSEMKTYMVEEENKLQITHTGIMVIQFLTKYFSNLFDYEYTHYIEENLRDINFKKYNSEIDQYISLVDTKKEEIIIDNENKLIIGKNGSVIIRENEYSQFIKVKQDIDLLKLQNGEYKIEEITDLTDLHYKGVYMDDPIYIKNGRYGIYTNWKGQNISLYYFKKVSIEKITLENIIWAIKQNAKKFNFDLL
uniref:DNA topoisomerase n=1 Tax=viral metagenome TaxID=1070528 RepID=A0A6C0HRA1_9ZZZZ